MQITEVKVFPVEEEKLKAYVTITLDDCFIVRDLKVISGKNGMFVAMPSKKTRDGSFKDIAHPLNSDTRRDMEKTILVAYHEELDTRNDKIISNDVLVGTPEDSPTDTMIADSTQSVLQTS